MDAAIELIRIEEKDLPVVKQIYDYYILNTTATFHTQKISLEELKVAIISDKPQHPAYLIKKHNEVCGYCYLGPFKKRQAYDRTAELTIYLNPEYQGKGIGKTALILLEHEARKNGVKVLLGVVASENTSSIALFERCKYEKCAHFKQVGEKFNRVLDVVIYQKLLDES